MAERRPLVVIAGQTQELPAGDTTPATFPATAGQAGKFLHLSNALAPEWTAAAISTPVAMVANAANLMLSEVAVNYVSVTGVLTANGQITTTFPANSTQVTFNNATTGAFLLQINAGAYTLPRGKSVWIWNGAVFEIVTPPNTTCFSVYLPTANQNLSTGAVTKIALSAKEFDLTNAFDAVTNYRFQPTIEGYYQIDWSVFGLAATNFTQFDSRVYKGSALVKYGTSILVSAAAVMSVVSSTGSALIYMNGTTDYLELDCYCVGTGALVASFGPFATFLNGSFVRPA